MKVLQKRGHSTPLKYVYELHDLRVGRCAGILARHLGLSASDAQMIARAAALHDIGKLGISSSIWQKPGTLTAEEWLAVKRHPEIGADWLSGSSSPVMRLAGSIALTHHERWDGSGYPLGLSGDNIPLAGRITMMMDQYDALRSERSYKLSMTHLQACTIILEGDDRTRPQHFDPNLLDLFRCFHQEFNVVFQSFQKRSSSPQSWGSMVVSDTPLFSHTEPKYTSRHHQYDAGHC